MDVKTYRARSLQEALRLVRHDLGPEAAVLHTREVRRGMLQWLLGTSEIEVMASRSVAVPSRLPPEPDDDWSDVAADDDLEYDLPESDLPESDLPESDLAPALSGPSHAGHELSDRDEDAAVTRDVDVRQDGLRAGPPLADLAAVGLRAAGSPAARPATERPATERPATELPASGEWAGGPRDDLQRQLDQLQTLVEGLCRRQSPAEQPLSEADFRIFTRLLDAELPEQVARDLIERVRATGLSTDQPAAFLAAVSRQIESEIPVCGPIRLEPGQRRLVALIGPTGVGKTTTIAKLAANFHLRERRRVGLITVDTYRIAAVEQLRTYADIIDLPMEVVSTPREMRAAVERFAELDLVLMDTAGRSPRDEVKIQELRSMLQEAQADEVHLVLSSVASESSLRRAAQQFARVNPTALCLTKLDEALALGSLVPVLRSAGLPLSYVTNGQNVPDDIQAANARQLAAVVLGEAGSL